MKGKILFVAGLATGYVLGARAGKERYAQIKTAWLKVWNAPVVQRRVEVVEDFAKARASAVPAAVWGGVKRVVGAVTSDGTPGEKLDATIDEVKSTKDAVTGEADEGSTGTGRGRTTRSSSDSKRK